MLEVCLEDQMRQCSCKEKSVLPIRIPLRKVELCLLRKFFARSKNQAPWGRRWVGRFQQDKERILLAAPGRKWGARRGRKPCGPNGTLPVMPASLHQNLKWGSPIHAIPEVSNEENREGAESYLWRAVGQNHDSISGWEAANTWGQKTQGPCWEGTIKGRESQRPWISEPGFSGVGNAHWQPGWAGEKLECSVIIPWVFPRWPAASVLTSLPSGSPLWFPECGSESSTLIPSRVFSSSVFTLRYSLFGSLVSYYTIRSIWSKGNLLHPVFPDLARHLTRGRFSVCVQYTMV